MQIGDQVDFELQDQNGQPVNMSQFRGSPVVLFFYPRADTPGCTVEACEIRDLYCELKSAGAVLLVISRDTVKAQKKFADKFSLPYTLLADPDHAVADAYGVWKEKNNYGKKYMGIERTTFVIDKNGQIAKIYPRVKVEEHAPNALAFVKTL